jgi:hypothetical protein
MLVLDLFRVRDVVLKNIGGPVELGLYRPEVNFELLPLETEVVEEEA